MNCVLKRLAKRCRERGISILLVGGWALNAHGVTRQTLDLDVLIDASQLTALNDILETLGYRQVYKTELFARYRAAPPELMDVDCLMTDAGTMASMLRDSIMPDNGDGSLPVPSLLHLIAMKLHALKHNKDRRYGRDLPDIMELIKLHELNPSAATFKELCLKFGTPSLHEEICMALGGDRHD